MSGTGWYVHHHGRGHITRFLAIRRHLRGSVTVFSSLAPPAPLPPDTRWVRLPPDDDARPDGIDPAACDPTARGVLHWAPLLHPGHLERMALIATTCQSERFERFVVDVSVEVSLLVRLLGVPTCVIAQPGERDDQPHHLAYQAASRILVPWARGLHSTPVLDDNADRARWSGAISRFDGRPPIPSRGRGDVVVLGAPAGPLPADDAIVLGGAGWREDPWELLSSGAVVVSAAGQNALADLAAAGARSVIVPQHRPFDEQLASARAVRGNELAVVLESWPTASQWPAVLDQARSLEPDWAPWQVEGGAQRAAAIIEGVTDA